ITVLAPLEAGLVIVSLAQLKGRNWSFGDFFSGFNWFGPIALKELVAVIMQFVAIFPVIFLFIALAIGMRGQNNLAPAAVAIMVGCGLIFWLILGYFALRIFLFYVPLVIDRSCSTIEAFQGSWRLTAGHFWGWFGTLLLLGLAQIG